MFNDTGSSTADMVPDLSFPSAANLIYLLRHPEKWPEGFRWCFSSIDCCAMGLSMEVWPDQTSEMIEIYTDLRIMPFDTRSLVSSILMRLSSTLGDFTGLSPKDAYGIFVESRRNITPAEMADQIEAHTTQEIVRKTKPVIIEEYVAPEIFIKPEEQVPDLSRPTLEALQYLLRHPEKWPKDFKWDYDSDCSCAIGLTRLQWPETNQPRPNVSQMSYTYGLTPLQEFNIFFDAEQRNQCEMEDVTPEMVADIINDVLVGAI